MAVKIQLRRGTTVQWDTTVDGIVGGTILAAGEVGVNTTTNQMKVGDGSTRWVNLPYFASGTITSVNAGTGITTYSTGGGSASSGAVSVAIDPTYVMARNIINAKGDIIVGTADDTPTALPVGVVNNYPLVVNSGAPAGVSWGQIVEAAIATSAVTTTKIADSNITTAKIADGNVTTGKIANSNVTLEKLASAVQNLLIPAGVIVSTLKSTADTGWIALNGTPVAGAKDAYPALWTATQSISGWWSGSTFTPPNMTNKMLEGVGATLVGQSGGSNTASLGASNLPAHSHTVNESNHTHGITEPNSGQGHVHYGPSGSQFTVQNINSAGGSVSTSTGPHTAYNHPNTAYATTGISINGQSTGLTVTGGGNGSATGNAFATTNAHIAVYFQIKAH